MTHRPAPMKPGAHVPHPVRTRRAHSCRGRACGRPNPCPGGDDNATAMYKGASFIHPTQETPSCGIMFSVHFANLVGDSPDDDEQTELLTRLYLESCPVDSVASKISRYEHAYLSLSAFARYLHYEQII